MFLSLPLASDISPVTLHALLAFSWDSKDLRIGIFWLVGCTIAGDYQEVLPPPCPSPIPSLFKATHPLESNPLGMLG